MIANGLIYLYAEAAGDVNSNSTTILVVLMFGVGTDYCLLLVSRYREELHRDRGQARGDGARAAPRRAGAAAPAARP